MKDNKEFIKGIYDKYDEYLKDEKNEKVNPQKSTSNARLKKVLSFAAAVVIAVSGVVATKDYLINKKDEPITIGKTTTTDKLSLKTVNDFETFYNIIKDNSKSNSPTYDSSGMIDEEMTVEDEIDESFNASDSVAKDTNGAETVTKQSTNGEIQKLDDYSKTNIQVENVDEADIVKTNGKYIFYVVTDKIIIVDIQDKSKMTKVSEISFENDNFTPSELYISDNK